MLANDLLRAIGCSAVVEDTWRIRLPTFLNPSACFREHPTRYGQVRAYFCRSGCNVSLHLQPTSIPVSRTSITAAQSLFSNICPRLVPKIYAQSG